MDTLDTIMTRRSIRSYLDKGVEKEKLVKIMAAATAAPSGMNTQGWHFSVITNKEVIKRLGAFVQEDDRSICYDAPVFIITSYEEDSQFGPFDTSCALENMMIAAHSLGLGSVWINRINKNEEKAHMMTDYGVPEGHRVYGCLALGYPKESAKEKQLRSGTVTWIE